MAICGQTLGVFKRENNNKYRNGEKTKLHKIEIATSFPGSFLEGGTERTLGTRLSKYNFDFMQLCLFLRSVNSF